MSRAPAGRAPFLAASRDGARGCSGVRRADGEFALRSVPEGWPARRQDPLVKICGVTTPALAEAAVAAGADMIGLVHFAPSPRHLPLDAAAEVAAAARGGRPVKAAEVAGELLGNGPAGVAAAVRSGRLVVALVVDADDATVDALVAAVRPDALQLHGHETPARIGELATRHGLPLLKAFGIATAVDLGPAAACAVLPLLDARPPQGADRPGGHGAAFDWSLLDGFSRSFMLSGGLTPETVAAAVARTRPYAVDVSSGVETHGRKDRAKMAEFVAAARG